MSVGIGGYWRDRRAEARLARIARRPIVWFEWWTIRVEQRLSPFPLDAAGAMTWRWWVWVGGLYGTGGSLKGALIGLYWSWRLNRLRARRARKAIERWTGRR